MSHTVNPELLSLARTRLFEKSAVVPPQGGDPSQGGGGDPSQQVGMPPMSPGALGVQQPVDPAQAAAGAAPPAGGGGAPPGMTDPSMLGALPPAQPQGAAPGGAGANAAQKLKPEQMMQMLDYRLYNMQQQLTAIMNAMGVQVDPASLVLPPGTTGAPPAESALPGGPMAPPPPQQGGDPSQGGGAPPAPGGGMPTGAGAPPDPNTGKQANWWERVDAHAISRVGRPVNADITNIDLQTKVSAAKALHQNLMNNAR